MCEQEQFLFALTAEYTGFGHEVSVGYLTYAVPLPRAGIATNERDRQSERTRTQIKVPEIGRSHESKTFQYVGFTADRANRRHYNRALP